MQSNIITSLIPQTSIPFSLALCVCVCACALFFFVCLFVCLFVWGFFTGDRDLASQCVYARAHTHTHIHTCTRAQSKRTVLKALHGDLTVDFEHSFKVGLKC